jgi:hypothetical protein
MKLIKFEDNRFIFLFFSLMLYFIIPPFFVDTTNRMHIISGLFSLMLVLSVYAIEKNKSLLHVSIFLAALVIIVHWLGTIQGFSFRTTVFDISINAVFFGLITISVIGTIIRCQEVTASTIFGAICGYLLMGLTWSFIHLLIHAGNEHAYTIPALSPNSHQIGTLNFIYFSFTTMSTVGYGDIVPVSHVARTFSWLEAITGQIYLTVWIARLIAMHITSAPNKG